MADSQPEATVDSGIVQMWRTDGRLYAIAGFLIGLMVFPLLASVDGGRLAGFLESLAPEAVSILVTVFFIDRLNRRRDAKNAEEALKRQLKDDAASNVNDVASNAVHQLRRKGWLEGENGLLKGADLRRANLERAALWDADLQAAGLDGAKYDENTKLPDESYWTPETDMRRFTDPEHPDFWRSDNPDSPAYRGKGEE